MGDGRVGGTILKDVNMNTFQYLPTDVGKLESAVRHSRDIVDCVTRIAPFEVQT